MAAALALVLALLARQLSTNSNDGVEREIADRMKAREAFLSTKMTQLLQEVEQMKGMEESTLLSALGQWQFWAVPAALLLVSVVCWVYWATVVPSACHSHQQSSGGKQKFKEEEDLKALPNDGGSCCMPIPSAMQGLPNYCKVVKELVDGLLSVCRVLSARNFMPQLYLATGTEDTYEGWAIEEENIIYHLLVFLQPPPGHSFSLHPDTTEHLPGRPSNIHVQLECLCWKKELLEGCVCQIHHHGNKVSTAQGSLLLENLCTSSYLDPEKVVRWGQLLVPSAWQSLPESHHCQVTVMPSSSSCKFQLTTHAEFNILTEIFFAVEFEN